MKKFDKIKIYFHHSVYLNLPFKISKRRRNILPRIIKSIWQIVFEICYNVGNWIMTITRKILFFLYNDFKSTQKSLTLRMKRFFQFAFVKTVISFLSLCLIGIAGLQLMQSLAKGFELKGLIVNKANLGSQQLVEAENALKQQNLDVAQNYFQAAYFNFTGAQKELEQTQGLIVNLLKITPIKKQADNLLTSATLISECGLKAIDLINNVSKLHFTAQGLETAEPTIEVFEKIEENLHFITENLEQAETNLSAVNKNMFIFTSKQRLLDAESNIKVLKQTFLTFKDSFYILKSIALGEKNILILFENNNELRATGGFMGSYGVFNAKDGKILKMHISSIYDLDGQLKEKILPPHPIVNVNNQWFLRDSNWFTNFPESAKKIISFYEKEGGETPNLIIALTPNLIIDILKITGPISLPSYQLILNSDNFVEATQVTTSITYQNPENNPKQILADLLPIIMQKLAKFDSSQWQVLLEDLQKNISEKQIILFSKDNQLQNSFTKYQIAGEVLSTDKDYLLISNSNLGGTKTDLYIDQKVNLKSTIQTDGSIINELTITRTNTLPKLEKTYNNSFLRVYVPLNSTLVSNLGFDYQNLDFEKPKDYKIDSEVYEWESKSVKDMVTGTIIGQESGKTFFGNWIKLTGGETKTVKLTYKLPFKLKDVDHYSLLFQKQPGAKEQKLNYELNFSGRKIEWKNFEPTQLDTNHLNLETILTKDFLLGAVLKNR